MLKIKNFFEKLKIFLLIVPIIFLTGCTQKNLSLNKKLIITGIAVDVPTEASDDYQVTVSAMDVQNSKENDIKQKIFNLNGKTVLKALENVSHEVGLQPIYSQNLVVIIGENAAKSGVRNFIDFFIRCGGTNPNVEIAVCDGLASEILSLKEKEKVVNPKAISDLIPDDLKSDLMHFVRGIYGKISDSYAMHLSLKTVSENEKKLTADGISVFSDGVLAGTLVDENMSGFCIAKGIFNKNVVLNSEVFGDTTLKINKIKSETKIEFEDSNPKISLNLDISASICEVNSSKDGIIGDEFKQVFSEKLNEKISDYVNKMLNELITLKSDCLNFGKLYKKSNPKNFKTIENDWKNLFIRSKFDIKVNSKIESQGNLKL